jgi:hypothetical protein
MTTEVHPHPAHVNEHVQARLALFGFLVTFILSRVFVFLIMARAIPNFYFFMRGTHVHHLNYGIFLLSVVGGYGILRRPTGRAAEATALLYGVAMGLTFDEFGMWLHLGGSYWQRASVDAVIVVSAVLVLCAYLRSIERWGIHHKVAGVVLLLFVLGFGSVVLVAGNRLGEIMGPKLQELEVQSSP